MTVELIISIIALALAALAAVRTFGLWTFFHRQKAKNVQEAEVPIKKEKKDGTNEDIFKKTLQSIEDYRKHR